MTGVQTCALPISLIGHTKTDHRMDRCWLQGAVGDALHALSCAAGYNIRWLLRAIVRLGLKGLLRPIGCARVPCLLVASHGSADKCDGVGSITAASTGTSSAAVVAHRTWMNSAGPTK